MSSTPANNKQKKLLISVVLSVLIVIVVNLIANNYYGKIDLTKDKRYTITDASKNMLKQLDGKVNIQVFLEGNKLPAAFKSLRSSTEELLKNFQDYSNHKVSYQFLDPLTDDNANILDSLKKYRMTGSPVTIAADNGTEQRMIFPWALVSYTPNNGSGTRSFPVFLQESNSMVLSRSILTKSEVLLEYNIGNAIQVLKQKEPIKIAYLTGNQELFGLHTASLIMAISKYYILDTVNINEVTTLSNEYKTIIVNAPTTAFTEIQKFKIDQYLMNGGSAIFAIDAVSGSIDSFINSEMFTAMPVDHNLTDLFFNYGIRLNNNLILDAMENSGIPVASNGQTQDQMFAWPYHPILKPNETHVITKNLEGVLSKFVSSIEILKNNPKIIKTPLLTSSEYSKMEGTPAPIIYKTVLDKPDLNEYNIKNIPAAVLLEGDGVMSAYANNRTSSLTQYIDAHNIPYQIKSKDKFKVIILGDGDIFKNEASEQKGPLDLGVYMFMPNYQFDNKSLLMNSIEYLSNDDNLLEARGKNFENRTLDPKRVTAEKSKWQILTILLPLVLIGLIGFVFNYLKKKRYAK